MPKRTSNGQHDPVQLAKSIVERATHGHSGSNGSDEAPKKNPAAVALGRLGGLKGGKARAESLSAKERSTIAKRAAQARWSSRPKG